MKQAQRSTAHREWRPPRSPSMTTNFFDASSPYLDHPLLTAERSEAEVDLLVPLLGLRDGDRILDVGCGFGRHSIEFAQRGFDVCAIDPSATMRTATQQQATSRGVDLEISPDLTGVQRDANAAIAMFTTVGQVGPAGVSNESIVKDIHDVLATGSRLVIEVPQRGPAVEMLIPSDTFGVGSHRTEVTRSFDPITNRVVEDFVVVTDNLSETFHLSYRLFDREELAVLLSSAGYTDVRFASSLRCLIDQTPLQPTDPTMVVVATATA